MNPLKLLELKNTTNGYINKYIYINRKGDGYRNRDISHTQIVSDFVENIITYQFKNDNDIYTPLFVSSSHKIESIIFKIGFQEIIKIPIDLCNKIYEYKCKHISRDSVLDKFKNKSNKEYIYVLPWYIFELEHMCPLALKYHKASLEFNYNENSINKNNIQTYVHMSKSYYNPQTRLSIYNKFQSLSHYMIGFNGEHIHLPGNQTTTKMLYTLHSTKGFFLDNICLDYIDNITIKLNGIELINYNNTDLLLFTEQISNNCIYIPFNATKCYEVNENKHWYNSYNSSRIDEIEIEITNSGEYDQNILLYNIHLNILQYNQHMAGLLLANSQKLPIIPEPKITESDLKSNQTNHTNQTNQTNPTDLTNSTNNIIFPDLDSSFIYEELDTNTLCPITNEEIKENSKYMKCDQCKNCFSEKILKDWLKKNNTCPTCRTNWKCDTIYVNKNINTSNVIASNINTSNVITSNIRTIASTKVEEI